MASAREWTWTATAVRRGLRRWRLMVAGAAIAATAVPAALALPGLEGSGDLDGSASGVPPRPPGVSTCCYASGGVGCSDDACEALVCPTDPFCCTDAWDADCAFAAFALCGALCNDLVPINDVCSNALPIANGDTPFSTVWASLDGPSLPLSCDRDFGISFLNDIWFVYSPTCTGTLTVSTCGQANYDTRLAAYAGTCDSLLLLSCNDDAPGCPGFTSRMTVPVTVGQPVLLRVGGFDKGGDGVLTLSCSVPCSPECPADFDRSSLVDGADLGLLLSQWGTPSDDCFDLTDDGQVDGADLGLLLAHWGSCSEVQLCPPSPHDCFTSGSPGCSDADCCLDVCTLNSYCCEVEWDGICVAAAIVLCTTGPCDCCQAGEVPGCSEGECEEAVCAVCSHCCNVAWDAACVAFADALCDCCEAPLSDCCTQTGGAAAPGCGDEACEAAVCMVNQSCCDVDWDQACVDAAATLCSSLCGQVVGGLTNNACLDAQAIGLGQTYFSTNLATTDGPALPSLCNEGFGISFVKDIWFVYAPPPGAQTLIVSTCGMADYDTRLAAYRGNCSALSLLACNDDGEDCDLTSYMVVPLVGATPPPVFIRVGGYNSTGCGVLELSLGP